VTIPQQIGFMTLGARDVAALRRFYASGGWTERDGGTEDFAQFQAGSVRLALYPLELLRDEAAPDAELAPEGAWSGVTLAVNLDSREAVDEAFRVATEAGAQPVASPVDREWGGYSGYVADPEGNRWELAWLPGSP